MIDFNVSMQETSAEFNVSLRESSDMPGNVYPLTVTENGTYDAGEDAAYNPVTVNVEGVSAEPLSVTENGTYTAPSGRAYSPVTVAVDTKVWHRPSDWPDLDSLSIPSDFDGVYLTYDLRKTEGYGWIGLFIRLQSNGSFTVERGHLSGSTFVADETNTVSASKTAYFRQTLDDTNGEVQLWRVYSSTPIDLFAFSPNTATAANNFMPIMQPCVERVGRLPNVTTINSYGATGTNPGNYSYGTVWLERDAVVAGTNSVVTSLANAWAECYRLQVLDLTGWDTTNWAVTTAATAWNACYALDTLTVPDTFDFPNVGTNNGAPNNPSLVNFNGFPVYANTSYANARSLSVDSLLNIIDKLPTVTSTTTLTLGQINKLKLTSAQIAVATGKGWTVA